MSGDLSFPCTEFYENGFSVYEHCPSNPSEVAYRTHYDSEGREVSRQEITFDPETRSYRPTRPTSTTGLAGLAKPVAIPSDDVRFRRIRGFYPDLYHTTVELFRANEEAQETFGLYRQEVSGLPTMTSVHVDPAVSAYNHATSAGLSRANALIVSQAVAARVAYGWDPAIDACIQLAKRGDLVVGVRGPLNEEELAAYRMVNPGTGNVGTKPTVEALRGWNPAKATATEYMFAPKPVPSAPREVSRHVGGRGRLAPAEIELDVD